VTADDEPALEPEEQVLPDGLDRLQHAAVDARRHPGRLRARIRRFGLEPLADERLQPQSRAVKSVSLRHKLQLRS
jgi:hypothetical protein